MMERDVLALRLDQNDNNTNKGAPKFELIGMENDETQCLAGIWPFRNNKSLVQHYSYTTQVFWIGGYLH